MIEDDETTDNLIAGDNPEMGDKKEEEMSMEELLKGEKEFSEKLYNGEIVKVKVAQVTDESVFVDISEKKEAIISLEDFKNEKSKPQVGDTVEAILEKKGGETRHTILSHKKAKENLSWQWCEKAFKAKERIKGRIKDIIKGGYLVEVLDIEAFMPMSLSEINGAHKHYLPRNAKVKFYITDFSERNKKFIVSRRQVLEEDEKERKKKIFSEINVGRVVRTVVSKSIEEGLFVRFQGIEGFVKLLDISWNNQKEAMATYKRGQRIKCKILRIDNESEKISFGIKQLTPNPVDIVKRKFPYKSIVKGKVISLSDEGAKIEVSDKVLGFIPVSEYGFKSAPKENELVKTVMVGVNSFNYQLNLSIKKLEGMEDRKRMQGYMKGSPSLTLGQILENSEDTEE
ncbi:MAG: S1 RNA-binding domain-containing protein [Elusimicrobia bacterium]|nr:S1 RNA-binding domain-containing protein [Elusimicrobiota bacterium]